MADVPPRHVGVRRPVTEPGRHVPTERLVAAFEDRNWACYVFTGPEDRPVGFAIVRDLARPVRVLGSFFVVRSVRRAGVGLQAVRAIIAGNSGSWKVAYQDANAAAARFWRRAAQEVAGSDWSEDREAVPGRPDLPPGVWISFPAGRKAQS